MSENDKNVVTVDYLIEIISSVKSALHNADDKNTTNHEILLELSETINVLTELYKRQNQDQKISQSKLDDIARDVQELQNKVEISKQKMVSSLESTSDTINIINDFNKQSVDGVNKTIQNLETKISTLHDDILFLKNSEMQKQISNNINKEKEKEKEVKHTVGGHVERGFFSKMIAFLRLLGNVGIVYKILMLVVGIGLVILWLTGVITADDLKNILQWKFF